MRLTTTTNVSVDGVMQGLGGADEDRSGGFDRGGWALPLLDTETEEYINAGLRRCGRVSLRPADIYEIFARSWATMSRSEDEPDRRRAEQPAQVRGIDHLTDPQWAATTRADRRRRCRRR